MTTPEGFTPFEIVGGDAPVCMDGVCVLPGSADESTPQSVEREDGSVADPAESA